MGEVMCWAELKNPAKAELRSTCAEFEFCFFRPFGQPEGSRLPNTDCKSTNPDRRLVSAHFGQQTKHFDIQPDERHR
jgi:hypothetical protein